MATLVPMTTQKIYYYGHRGAGVGLKLFAVTVNDREEIARMKLLGVDAFSLISPNARRPDFTGNSTLRRDGKMAGRASKI